MEHLGVSSFAPLCSFRPSLMTTIGFRLTSPFPFAGGPTRHLLYFFYTYLTGRELAPFGEYHLPISLHYFAPSSLFLWPCVPLSTVHRRNVHHSYNTFLFPKRLLGPHLCFCHLLPALDTFRADNVEYRPTSKAVNFTFLPLGHSFFFFFLPCLSPKSEGPYERGGYCSSFSFFRGAL